jgi:rare lipoprotein A
MLLSITFTMMPTEIAEPLPSYRVPYISSLTVETATPDVCVASWYGGGEPLNELTASGEPFDSTGMNVAAWDYPFGTVLEVTGNGRTVEVTVNDRGPARRLGRCLDLTKAAFGMLASTDEGLLTVSYKIVDKGN